MKMELCRFILLVAGAAVFTGCAATRTVSDVGFGAAGAVIASQATDGDPLATAVGAAGGVLVSEGLHYAAGKQAEKAYVTGYEKGRSDAVKQQYWLYVSMQQGRNRGDRVRLYEVTLPEQMIEGVIFKSTTKQLRIEE